MVEHLDEEPQPCVDYRQLSRITRHQSYPLPNMERTVERLSEAQNVYFLNLFAATGRVHASYEHGFHLSFRNVKNFALGSRPSRFVFLSI